MRNISKRKSSLRLIPSPSPSTRSKSQKFQKINQRRILSLKLKRNLKQNPRKNQSRSLRKKLNRMSTLAALAQDSRLRNSKRSQSNKKASLR